MAHNNVLMVLNLIYFRFDGAGNKYVTFSNYVAHWLSDIQDNKQQIKIAVTCLLLKFSYHCWS